MPDITVSLYYSRGIGWNFGIAVDGRSLPADDPIDADSIDNAYRTALVQLAALLDDAEARQ